MKRLLLTLAVFAAILGSLDPVAAQSLAEDFSAGTLPSDWRPFSRSTTGAIDSANYVVAVESGELTLAYSGPVRSAVWKQFDAVNGQKTLSFKVRVDDNTTRNFITFRDSNEQVVSRMSIGRVIDAGGIFFNTSFAITTQMNTDGLLPAAESIVAQAVAPFKSIDFLVSITFDFATSTVDAKVEAADGSSANSVTGIPMLFSADHLSSLEVWQFYTFNTGNKIYFDDFLISDLDKTSLLAAIGSVQDFLNVNTFGSQPGEYPAAQQQLLSQALVEAQAVCDTASTQQQLEDEALLLLSLLETAKASLIPLTYGSLVIDTDLTAQTIKIYGTDAKLSVNRVISANDLDQVIRLMYEDCPLEVLRIPIFPAQSELIEGQVDMSVYDSLLVLMNAIVAIKPDIQFFASPAESDPVYAAWMLEPKAGNRNSLGQKYGRLCADYWAYMKTQGFDIHLFGPTNEDGGVEASDHVDIMDGFWANLPPTIDSPLVVAPDRWGISNSTNMVQDLAALNKMDYVDFIGSHHYDDGIDNLNFNVEAQINRWDAFSSVGTPYSIDSWHTEGTRFGKGGGMDGAVLGMMQMWYAVEGGITGHMIYQGMNSQILNINGAGDLTITQDYYIYKDFTNATIGAVRIPVDYPKADPVRVVAFKTDSTLSVFALNYSDQIPVEGMNLLLAGVNLASNYQRVYWDGSTGVEGITSTETLTDTSFTDNLAPYSYVAYHFTLDNTTSLREESISSIFTIAPNPASSSIRILGERNRGPVNYQILDLQGRAVSEGSTQTGEAISIDQLPSGVYLLKVNAEEKTGVLRFVKE